MKEKNDKEMLKEKVMKQKFRACRRILKNKGTREDDGMVLD